MARKKRENKIGLSISEMRSLINKKAGVTVAHNLVNENPTEVKEWIPTGSRWLDSIICRGKLAGIPVGKISEIAGLEASGKSYMAAKVAANAQKKGIDVVYFDSESAIDPAFLRNAGCDIENLIYVQAQSVEFVLETIEQLLSTSGKRMLFIWDSLALTPAIGDIEGDFNPQSSMALKARILAKGMSKLTVPIANSQSTFLVLNQLKANITRSMSEALTTPYVTPGGKAMVYAYSLRIWLTGRKAKASFIQDEHGFRIGSEVKATLKKSRFGTQGRQATFKILWGDEVRILDKESWFEAVKGSEKIKGSGAWYALFMEDGSEVKFQTAGWVKKLEDEKFKARILQILDEEVILKFKDRSGNAGEFYDIDGKQDEEKSTDN
jgi:recombination protein RecA